jgi:Kef-type K+ transport system membrane component KefB
MGISLKVLEEGKVLSTPTGQLIIAAAVIDDVIALVLLAQVGGAHV